MKKKLFSILLCMVMTAAVLTAEAFSVIAAAAEPSGSTGSSGIDLPIDLFADELKNLSSVNSDILSIGSRIYMTGAAEGGTAPYTYAYYYKRTTSKYWNTVGAEWTTSVKQIVTIKSAGSFNIRIAVKDAKGSTKEKSFTVNVTDGKSKAFRNNSTINTAGAVPGTTIILTGAASGSEGYRYAFYYKRTTAVAWTILGDEFGTGNLKGFTPKTEGEFNIKIDILDKNGELVSKQFALTISSAYTATAMSNTSEINTVSALPGTRIILTGAANGGTAPYSYAYYYKKCQASKWTVIGTEFGTAETAAVTLRNKGDYIFRVVTRDANGQVAKIFGVEITDTPECKLTNKSTISAGSVSVNTTVSINGAAVGGTAPYRYAFYYKRRTSKTWNVLADEFGTSQTASFKPRSAGEYNIRVVVKDEAGDTAEKEFDLTAE